VRVTLLGTGSADGWPNPFCDCHSCGTERADGRSRAPSAALIDDAILVDCGPTTPHLPGARRMSLANVAHVLVTHGHPDHLHPAFLLTRQWVPTGHVLHVWGPAAAMDLCRPWLGPDACVELHVVAPSDRLDLATPTGRYHVNAHPAAHTHGDGDALAEEALLFAVTDPGGARLLYATDTGPLPQSTLDAMEGPFDVVLVDETFGDMRHHGTGHLDLSTLPELVADLRSRELVTPSTVIVATHLSHHNPPTPELRERLAPLGVRVAEDLDVIDTVTPGGAQGGRHLVLGGARAGKSRFAERLMLSRSHVMYVATGGTRPDDPEWIERVAAHRERRPSHWITVETTDVSGLLDAAPAGTGVLVDCIALWLTGHLDAIDAWSRAEAGDREAVGREINALTDQLAASLSRCAADVILVSNEVGMGVVPGTPSGRLFQDLLGTVNSRLADVCTRTTLVVAGQGLSLRPPDKGEHVD
jgi:adenosylcobinamide kinase / adenosylcobinamide-phosphate guanylyltransferase